ncbi:MAG: glycosyltransferase family 4 protein [Microcystis aeruginosa G13-05]|jgi:glycosyltransferase involved in cell wall biosynthesis|nr:glycosyltransferase family 4 protein [Microcystis aeruginosa BK11-02]NCS51683.1 glycosyltransferase family 4 protein [Microcystis aeruginosa G13-05]
MKILLIANYPPDHIQSMNRFAQILETGLTELGHQVHVIRPQPWIGRLQPSSKGLGKWLGYIDKFLLFPNTLRQELSWADVVHICDQSNAVYTKYLQKVPHVVTCNDLLAIRSALGEIKENHTRWTGRQLQKMILNGLNQAQRVACISEQTKMDLMRLSSLRFSTISLIHMGLNYRYFPMKISEAKRRLEALEIPKKCQFFLHVGGNTWYKNRLGVLSIFYYLLQKHPKIEDHLVMVGQPFTIEIRQFIKKYNLSQTVIEMVGVDNEDLRALYSSATALLFPSLQEGFGWPIIEAQACGCPVITSKRPPMTEVGGEAAIYINPTNPEEAAEIIAGRFPILKSLKQKGILNAQKFTADKMITSYLELYQTAIFEKK